jgi:hypothetical protein
MNLLKLRILPLMLVLLGIMAACTSQTPETTETAAPEWFSARQATEGYVNVAAAETDGYAPITDCIANPAKGAMGIHYANGALLGDPALDVTQPEVLMYHPLSDGRLELVGVEYLIPGPAWSEADPPTILGQELEYREDLDLYALHLWAWRNNPNGLYADWNPNLDCAGADAAEG